MTKAKQLGIKNFPYHEYDFNGNLVYREYSSGYWQKYIYDSNNNLIYKENSGGDYERYDFDSNGNMIYYETCYIGGFFKYYEGDELIKIIKEGCKEHYLAYKRNLLLNKILN